ncbi:ABC transporter ATP-binding protein [Citricoccus muralis]|uniref:ABC transporter ATP-binding protein n=1 Tax=Citricoccus muralis TaxID=169134 RepID=A0ABY8H550_9MICC|nr:ABC transporter ATP-binding protein [Citricoccus muralis]WFP16230.1 ABC transporter ATP-binding protein [Citricoccus muralis]
MTENALVEYDQVTITNSYTGEAVVSGFSATLHPGEVLGLVGESGSGKSITCRSLLGILPRGFEITGGTARVFGNSAVGLSDQQWQQVRGVRIGAVFQDPGSYLNPSIKIGSQIAEPLRIRRGLNRRDAKTEVLRLFKEVHLPSPEDLFQRYTFELSGGMLQRVLLAGALALNPEVLIADEATTALDVTVQAEILDLFQELQQTRQLALIVVSHDLAVVSQLCDRIIVLRNGEIVDQGSVEDIIHHPRHEYTRLLVDEHEKYGLEKVLSPERSRP